MVRTALFVWICIAAASFETEADEPARGQSNTTADDPPHLLVVRLSLDAFRNLDRRQIDETVPVSEVVLGTRAAGTARVQGQPSFELEPNQDDAGLTLQFSGTSTSRTVSRRGPAIIQSVVTCQFVGVKPIVFDLDRGFRYREATSHVNVISTQRSIQSTVGGLRGRLVRRIANRRVSALSGYLDHVAERSTAQRIEQSFDREANRRLVVLNTAFRGLRLALQQPALQRNGGKYDVSLNTTDRYLQIGVGLKGIANPDLPDTDVPPLPVQVWAHASLFGEQALPLVETWDELRALWPAATNISGLAAALGMQQTWQDASPRRSVQLTPAMPWVVIGAGREEVSSARQTQDAARRF